LPALWKARMVAISTTLSGSGSSCVGSGGGARNALYPRLLSLTPSVSEEADGTSALPGIDSRVYVECADLSALWMARMVTRCATLQGRDRLDVGSGGDARKRALPPAIVFDAFSVRELRASSECGRDVRGPSKDGSLTLSVGGGSNVLPRVARILPVRVARPRSSHPSGCALHVSGRHRRARFRRSPAAGRQERRSRHHDRGNADFQL
jgi:hypothetical protein